MAKEQDWDDSYLDAEEDLTNFNPDDLDNSGLPIGKWLCVVDSVKGKRGDFKITEKGGPAYTAGIAVLKWKCIEGEQKGTTKIGQIRLPHPKEPDWAKNQRHKVLYETGVIKRGDSGTKKINYKAELEGRKCFITVEKGSDYKDKKTNETKKGLPQITMFGYEAADGTNPATQPQDDYEDV